MFYNFASGRGEHGRPPGQHGQGWPIEDPSLLVLIGLDIVLEIFLTPLWVGHAVRVAHLSPYRSSDVSGINRMIGLLAKRLELKGIHVSLWCPGEGAEERSTSIIVLPVPTSRARNLTLALRTAWALLARRTEVDLVHGHQPHLQCLLGLVLAKVLGIPSVVTLHVRAPARGVLNGKVQDWLAWAETRIAAATVAVSERVASDFRVRNARIIRNGVPIGPPAVARDTEGQPVRGVTLDLVYAGRITPSKGIAELLDAISKVSASVPEVHLTTFGPVDDAAGYERAKRYHGVKQLVTDLGVDSQWMNQTRQGQVFVLPSHYEGVPLALLEAMAAGLGVVASAVGGIPEIVRPTETGLLVTPGDVKELVQALSWMATHPDAAIEMGRRARASVVENLSDEKMAAAYLDVYRQVTRLSR